MKKHLCLLLAVVMTATLFGGCAGQQNTVSQSQKSGKDDKIKIYMYMWDRSMLKELSPWLEKKFPEIEFHSAKE